MDNRSTSRGTIIAKVVLLGDAAVGKTSIRKRYMGASFQTMHLMTLGADFSQKSIEMSNNRIINLQIWDIAGQEYFEPIRKRFLSDTSIAIIVFDITDKKSFEKIDKWINEVWNVSPEVNIPILFIGNKIDLFEDREVTNKDVNEFIEQLHQIANNRSIDSSNWIKYIETSALTGENIEDAFQTIADKIYELNI